MYDLESVHCLRESEFLSNGVKTGIFHTSVDETIRDNTFLNYMVVFFLQGSHTKTLIFCINTFP